MAARIISQFQGAATSLQKASLYYLAAILLVFAIVVNVIARLIVQRTTLRDTEVTPAEAEAL
jgi:ABC-type phosphate transport system permease subunit